MRNLFQKQLGPFLLKVLEEILDPNHNIINTEISFHEFCCNFDVLAPPWSHICLWKWNWNKIVITWNVDFLAIQMKTDMGSDIILNLWYFRRFCFLLLKIHIFKNSLAVASMSLWVSLLQLLMLFCRFCCSLCHLS